ncbi:MAG: hypothetical protein WCK34_08405 [Bacteroidota bacterium]
MKTKNLLSALMILAVIFSMSFMGCEKDINKVPTSTDNGQNNSGLKAAATGSIVTAGTVVNGDYRAGVALASANTLTLKVAVTAIGTYNIYSSTVNGYSFSKSGSFTATGTQVLTLPATGTPVATGINTFTVTFGTTGSFTVVVVSNTPIVFSSCNTSYTYMEVANHKTTKVWLDRNLGASRVGQSAIDFLAYGSFYQWGRLADNHQCITWATSYLGTPVNGVTLTKSATNTPPNALFIKTSTSPWDWRVPQNNALWQGVSGVNNPCPAGFRVPTLAEFTAELASWASKNTAGAFGSSLKWVTAGYRDFPDGNIYQAGNAGAYWTSSISSTQSSMLWFAASEGYTADDYRAVGYSVRCIKN